MKLDSNDDENNKTSSCNTENAVLINKLISQVNKIIRINLERQSTSRAIIGHTHTK